MKERVGIVILVLLFANCSGLFAEDGINGKWWSQLHPNRKDNFVDGYSDCLLIAGIISADESTYFDKNGMIAAVDAYVQGDPKRQSEPLSPLMDRLIPQYLKHIKREGKGEPLCGPDAPPFASIGGEVWANLHFSPSEGISARAAYLTGYLECYRTHVKNGLHFSKPVSFYEAKLNEFYRIVDDPDDPDAISEFNDELACFPIAEALKKYADEVLEKQKR
jgi:hypothetical protein